MEYPPHRAHRARRHDTLDHRNERHPDNSAKISHTSRCGFHADIAEDIVHTTEDIVHTSKISSTPRRYCPHHGSHTKSPDSHKRSWIPPRLPTPQQGTDRRSCLFTLARFLWQRRGL